MKIRNNNEMIIYLLIGNAAHASFILWYTLDACTTLKYAFVSSRGKKIKHNDRVSLQLNHHHPSMDHGCFFVSGHCGPPLLPTRKAPQSK